MGQAGQGGSAMEAAGAVATWYVLNISVLLSNKALLSSYDFSYPALLTLLHMLTCWGASAAAARTGAFALQPLSSPEQRRSVRLLALMFGAGVVLGNVALQRIPVSFEQALGATTPFFVVAFGVAFFGQRESREVLLSLVPVVAGIVVASGFEPSFEAVGFAAALASTAIRALRSLTQGALLSSPSERLDSMSLLAHMAPVAAAALAVAVAALEPAAPAALAALGRADGRFVAALAANCALAYGVNLANFVVTKRTSALTLQVMGNAKSAVAAGVSVLVFKNPVSGAALAGFAVTVGGVALYSRAKVRAAAAAGPALPAVASGGKLGGGGGGGGGGDAARDKVPLLGVLASKE